MSLGMACSSWLVAIGVIAWLLLALFVPRLMQNPRENVETGLVWYVMRGYSRVVHRLRVMGKEHVPRERYPGPLIVVANHSAGVDPVLIQSAVPFEVRFMMARDMQPKVLEPLWKWVGVIAVDRDGGDMKAARDAIRYLHSAREVQADGTISSGVIGIFPEGGIERPAERLMPFLPGVGLLVHRSGARVLPVIVRGTPRSATAWGSLLATSRSTVEFLPVIDYATSGLKPAGIAEDFEEQFRKRTGWAMKREASQKQSH